MSQPPHCCNHISCAGALCLAQLLAAVGGCSPPCADGTVEQDDECVPAWAHHVCGEGTTARPDGTCVPTRSSTCGEGTVELGGLCIPDSSSVGPCGTGTVMREGTCVGAELQHVSLPFPEGTQVTLSQGFLEAFTHNGEARYAVDFPADEGSALVAARDGTVFYVKQDSSTGCADESCKSDANVIYIDHGDGTMSHYGHLQYQGAKVQVGQAVCKGQEIGLSGNTGYSTGPHLHFSVNSLLSQTLPLVFEELTASDGVPFVGPTFVSQNALQVCDKTPRFSSCPADVFKAYGVVLDPGFPCAAVDVDKEYTLSGKVLDSGLDVLLSVWVPMSNSWSRRCVHPASDGTFTTTLTWGSGTFKRSTYTTFGVMAASTDCEKTPVPDHGVNLLLR